jgi:hypothetical protein
LTNARIKSAAGSDFRYWQHGRVMDAACATVVAVQATFIGMSIRTNPDPAPNTTPALGSINELDARRLETQAENALRAILTQPNNVEGTRRHVSELDYQIDRTNNVLTTETIQSDVSIQPLGYPKTITTTIGFTVISGV